MMMSFLHGGWRRLLALAAVALAASVPSASDAQNPTGQTPRPEPTGYEASYLPQGWDRENTDRWYHVSQGTVFMPAEWFVALPQASGTAPFAAPDHLARLGFLPDPAGPQNPLGLPVGFAVRSLDFPDNDKFRLHYQFWKGQWVGLTCAACHTGQLNFHGQRIRIEGGPAHLDIERFGEELAAALAATATIEPRFQEFAATVRAFGAAVTADELRQKLTLYLQDQAARNSVAVAGALAASEEPTRAGLGRLDAVHRGGNILLSAPLLEVRNYVPTTAPVRYPMLWDTPYFDWVLYNASIRQPMARNVIEDLGVGAPIDPETFLQGTVKHAVLMGHLVDVHRTLKRLESPQWPEAILGKIDRTLAGRGGPLFAQHCASCHQPIDRGTHAGSGNQPGPVTVTIKTVSLEEIGTDPRQAKLFAQRMVNLEHIGGPAQIQYLKAAELLAGRVVDQWAKASAENGYLEQEVDNGRQDEFRGPQAYRARPLNGLWATPPYLHNGSVPSMDDLLRPVSRRPRIFYVGSWEYDPSKVGLVVGSPFEGAFMFDTRLPGNSNTGHEYGTGLSDDDRKALLEYLKTL
jgi:hypothetical protein